MVYTSEGVSSVQFHENCCAYKSVGSVPSMVMGASRPDVHTPKQRLEK